MNLCFIPDPDGGLLVEVLLHDREEFYICGVHGQATTGLLDIIEEDLENYPEPLNRGEGLYLLRPKSVKEDESTTSWQYEIVDFKSMDQCCKESEKSNG